MGYYCLALVIGSFGAPGSHLNWLVYTVPPAACGAWAAFGGKLGLRTFARSSIALALIATACAFSVMASGVNAYSLRDAYFWMSPFLFSIFITRIEYKHLQWLLWACIVCLFGAYSSGQYEPPGFNLLASQSLLETVYTFPVGLLLIAFFLAGRGEKSNLLNIAICVLFMMISFKRISLAGIVIACALYYIIFIHINKKIYLKYFYVSIFAALAIFSINSVNIISYVNENFLNIFRGSPEELLLGRASLYFPVKSFAAANSGEISQYFGFGIGKIANSFGELWSTARTRQLHNDYLRILFETGVFGLFCVMAAYGLLIRRNAKTLAALVYMLLLFISDNTLSYPFFTVSLIVVIRWFETKQRETEACRVRARL